MPNMLKFKTKIFISGFLISFMSSCGVWRHETSPHNTPNFSDKNQHEISAMVGWTGFDLSTAYSPLKYFALQLNSTGSTSNYRAMADTNRVYNWQVEGGVTAYWPLKKFTLGITAGFGLGSTEWRSWWYSGDSYNQQTYALYDTKKIYFNPYIIYKWKHQPNYSGISIKINMLDEYYNKTSYNLGRLTKYNYPLQVFDYQIQYFIRLKLSNSIFLRFDFGAAMTSDELVRPTGGVGLTFKIPKFKETTGEK